MFLASDSGSLGVIIVAVVDGSQESGHGLRGVFKQTSEFSNEGIERLVIFLNCLDVVEFLHDSNNRGSFRTHVDRWDLFQESPASPDSRRLTRPRRSDKYHIHISEGGICRVVHIELALRCASNGG